MYVGIDVGGTKTIAAVLNFEGVIVEKAVFQTDRNYHKFLDDLSSSLDNFSVVEFAAGGIGVPATRLDRKHGRVLKLSNLPWTNVSIQHDVQQITGCPIVMENDAKLAALSESMVLKDNYSSVLYVTISTGIGFAFVKDGVIDTNFGDGGGRTMILEYKNQHLPWEDFASGRAILNKYGKLAKDIEDETIWKAIARELAKGFIELIAIVQPEVIVIGGGVGNYFDRFGSFLRRDIEKYHIPLIKLPEIIKAQRPDDAVIYGCYDIARQYYPHARVN